MTRKLDRQTCTDAKANPVNDSARSSGAVQTERSGRRSAFSENDWPAVRAVSSARRVGSAAAITTRPVMATPISAARQPSSSATPGITAPASAAPAGTPVCLIEKVSAMREGGVVRIRTADDAGVIGP